MENELCLPPLRVRRTYLGGKFWMKCKSLNNVTIRILECLFQYKNNSYWRCKGVPLLLDAYEYFRDLRIQSSQKLDMFALNTWVGNVDLNSVIITNIDNIKIAKRLYNPSDVKKISEEFINLHYNHHYKLYTDGSKDGVLMGAAFLDSELGTVMKYKINNNIFIMNIELLAICEALAYIKSIKSNKFVIFTDSRSSLQHLARCTSAIRGTTTAYSVLELILELKIDSKSVILQWIPSHCNVGDNEKVDILAKQACNEGVLIDIPPYYTDCLYLIRKRCYWIWSEYFDQRSKEKGIWYKTIEPHPPRKPWIDNANLNRSDMVSALRLRSGHVPSRSFAFLMRKVLSPNCPDCGVIEDTYHILMECVRNETCRRAVRIDPLRVGECNGILASPSSERAKLLYKLLIP